MSEKGFVGWCHPTALREAFMTGIIKLFDTAQCERISYNIVGTQMKRLADLMSYIADGYRRKIEPAHNCSDACDAAWRRLVNAARELLAGQYSELADMLTGMPIVGMDDTGSTLSRVRLKAALARRGIKTDGMTIIEKKGCSTEVHMIARATSRRLMPVDEVAYMISRELGMQFLPRDGFGRCVGSTFEYYVFRQQEKYILNTGAVKASKNAGEPSGDSFSVFSTESGEAAIILSDGCGSGEQACMESSLVTALVEGFLNCGFKEEGIISLVSAVLLMANEAENHSTLDMCLVNLFDGRLRLAKSGASLTFIKHEDWVESISTSGLPLGILPDIQPEITERRLSQGDSVIVLSDGVLDGLPVREKEALLQDMIRELPELEPRDMAGAVLMSSLRKSYYEPVDDMTVIVGRLEPGA